MSLTSIDVKTLICDNSGHCPRIFSVIIFHGDCLFKDVSEIPNGTMVAYAHHLGRILKDMGAMPDADYCNLDRIRRVLRQAARNGQDSSVIAKTLSDGRIIYSGDTFMVFTIFTQIPQRLA